MTTIFFVSMGLLLCAVIAGVYWVFLCIKLSTASHQVPVSPAVEAEGEGCGEKGLTEEELERLEKGKMVVGDGEMCAICCDDMVEAQEMRVLPGCCHAFHRSCVDTWLQRKPLCPLCRAHLLALPLSFLPSQPQPQSPPS